MIRRLIGVYLVSGLQRIINFFAVHRKFEPVVRSTADLHHAVRRSFKFIEQIHWSLLGELVAKFREVNRVVFHLHRFRFRPVRGPGNFPFRIQRERKKIREFFKLHRSQPELCSLRKRTRHQHGRADHSRVIGIRREFNGNSLPVGIQHPFPGGIPYRFPRSGALNAVAA